MFGNDIVDPMLENLIKQMLLDINTMLSLYDYDLEHYTVTARETEQSLDLSNVNLVDVESEKLFSVLRSVLDKMISDDIVNEYGNSDIAINQVLRGATREGMFVFEAEDLDSETRMLMNSQSMFMDVSLRLNRVEISNLDKFTAVDLLVVLRNLLGSNEAMSTYVVFDVRRSTRKTTHFTSLLAFSLSI